MEICSNENCEKAFKVSVSGAGFVGGEELEDIDCPYCKQTVRRERTSGTYFESKLDAHKLLNESSSIRDFAEVLRAMYQDAPRGEQVLMIHLFGIKFGEIIRIKNISISTLVTEARMSTNYVTELNKGIGLAKYVHLKERT
ncbi:HTH-like domain-containing protein [Vibrio metschnikovii]|uniref:HTH-like domain-containing protein n=1 Tax=Vibrio metschnikovii TaxID=28172 RepID=UPI001C2FE034|nr:hypothetical protein [Vibrio metschnikovii]